ncbi:oligoribonuclease [Gammaproteobacteria bacterium]
MQSNDSSQFSEQPPVPMVNVSQNPSHLVWIDLEMTGLEPESDLIIEIATLITDTHLNLVAEGPVIAVHQNDTALIRMDEWNTRQHHSSGLVARVRASRIDVAQAERLTLDFVSRYVPANKSPICGNSICQDRRFLARYMPTLEKWFHYRNLDVSTVKELAKRWAPTIAKSFKKNSTHLAIEDIRASVAELRHYREHFLSLPTGESPGG